MQEEFRQLTAVELCNFITSEENREFVRTSLKYNLNTDYVDSLLEPFKNIIMDRKIDATFLNRYYVEHRILPPYMVSLRFEDALANTKTRPIFEDAEQYGLRLAANANKLMQSNPHTFNADINFQFGNQFQQMPRMMTMPNPHLYSQMSHSMNNIEKMFSITKEELVNILDGKIKSRISYHQDIIDQSRSIYRRYCGLIPMFRDIVEQIESEYSRFIFDMSFPVLESEHATIIVRYYDMKTDYKECLVLKEFKFPEDFDVIIKSNPISSTSIMRGMN